MPTSREPSIPVPAPFEQGRRAPARQRGPRAVAAIVPPDPEARRDDPLPQLTVTVKATSLNAAVELASKVFTWMRPAGQEVRPEFHSAKVS